MKKSITKIITILLIAVMTVCMNMYSYAKVKGDVNNDGGADNKDVVALFRYVSGNNKVSDEYVYDYNNDGFANNKDVVDLFRVLSGGKDTETSAVTEEQENNEYKIYLYANGEGGEGDGKTEGYTGKNFLGMADESKKQNMGGKTIEIFGGEQTMLYMETISFGICDEKYDMYIGDNGLFTFGETTGRLATYDYLSGGRADGFTPPVKSNSSQQEFIDYAKNVLLEYTGTSVDDCDVLIKQYGSKYNIIFRKRFSGIYRIDDLMVTINNSGDVLKIKARVCDNLFEPFKDVKIDAEKLKEQIYDLSYDPSYVSYEILLRAIPDGNELWVIADVNYEYDVDGELFGSVVQYITKVAEIPSDQTEPEPYDTEFETWDAYAGTEAE